MDYVTPNSIAEAIAIQQDLRQRVHLADDFGPLKTVAGIDVGYDLERNISKAALILLDWQTLKPIQSVTAEDLTPFPYVPGLLSFREVPVLLKALSLLETVPDLLFVDGQGIAHPRRLGIASHIGVLSGLPSIGVAKSVLCGRYEDPANTKGATSPLMDKTEQIGTACRSRPHVKPIFISPGHRTSHETAVNLTLRCVTRYRLPEPTRLADKLSKINKIPLLI